MVKNSKIQSLKIVLKRFQLPLFIFFLFWASEIVVLFFLESNKEFLNLLLISMGIRTAESGADIVGVYQLLWPTFFELLVIGMVFSVIFERYGYNPLLKAQKLAKKKSNHTVVLGYNHLGERIVDYLREHKKHYSLIEIEMEKIEDLITLEQPAIVGDYTDDEIMKKAGIHKCKEVFCVTTELKRALIAAENVRKLNKDCALFMRVFDEHFREYLTNEPWRAYTFSTSKWAMESIIEWSKDVKGGVIVLGSDTLAQRIGEYLGTKLKGKVYLIDSALDEDKFSDYSNVTVIKEDYKYLENLEDICILEKTKQVYICWNEEKLFSDAIILTMALRKKYPNIGVFVRIFDEELANIAKHLEATTFSTSAHAFNMLQREVSNNSNIYPMKKE
ncbi:MAG: NAD-binding protein [Candidatus Heimdallarchaeaceae archaeon]